MNCTSAPAFSRGAISVTSQAMTAAQPGTGNGSVDGHVGSCGRTGVDIRWSGQRVCQIPNQSEHRGFVFVPRRVVVTQRESKLVLLGILVRRAADVVRGG